MINAMHNGPQTTKHTARKNCDAVSDISNRIRAQAIAINIVTANHAATTAWLETRTYPRT
jgi:hypothetical protein